ncbi:MAG: preprotein translocase subunit YajC [Candidatus Omnitrophica bacterium]|nr:preprotein translocase subunit YajC [Candidatus Omnitrophota bacterium]
MPQAPTVNPLLNFLPLILIFIVFYFLLIRPQKAKEKEHQNMLTKLAKNDEVVTTGGIHGVIVNVKDKSLTLRVDDNVKIEVEKNCIAYVKKTQVA